LERACPPKPRRRGGKRAVSSVQKKVRISSNKHTMTIFPYLISRFFYRLAEFFRHWYISSFRIFSHYVISILEKLDRRFALKITLKHLFQPLYQDRTLIGYILGFFFRSGRLILGGIVYLGVLAIAVFCYFIWLAIPLYIILRVIYGA
jgi:hypothetical protein